MRGLFSLISLLLVVAIIGYVAKSYFQPPASHDPNDKSTVEYWVAHDGDRASMVSYCGNHPELQNTGDCKLAIEAQAEVDSRGGASGASTSTGGNRTGVDQASGEANDQLQAQQDSNTLDQGQP